MVVQVTINLKTLNVGDVIGEDCVLGFETRQYQVKDVRHFTVLLSRCSAFGDTHWFIFHRVVSGRTAFLCATHPPDIFECRVLGGIRSI